MLTASKQSRDLKHRSTVEGSRNYTCNKILHGHRGDEPDNKLS